MCSFVNHSDTLIRDLKQHQINSIEEAILFLQMANSIGGLLPDCSRIRQDSGQGLEETLGPQNDDSSNGVNL